MKRTAESGMTLIEVTVAAVILAVSLLGLVAAMSVQYVNSGISDDSQLAVQALRRKIEDMRASDFSSFFTTWSGHTFTVPGLRARSSGAPHGSVAFLSEAVAKSYWSVSTAPALVDLDADGVFDENVAPSAGWKVYAVRVTITWGDKVRNQDRTLDVTTVMFDPGS